MARAPEDDDPRAARAAEVGPGEPAGSGRAPAGSPLPDGVVPYEPARREPPGHGAQDAGQAAVAADGAADVPTGPDPPAKLVSLRREGGPVGLDGETPEALRRSDEPARERPPGREPLTPAKLQKAVAERIRTARRPRLPTPPGPGEPRRRPRLKKLRIALVFLGLSILAFVAWIFGIMMAVAQDLPSLETRAQYLAAENSVVKDINGQRIATLTNNEGLILLESEEIAPVIKDAVVAIEDQRFYEHRGIDFLGIARAVKEDILAGSAEQGASTITMQFVKNALAAQDERTVFQKLREAGLAYHMERQWSKDKILTNYLNEIYFGEGATGVEAAAQTYFGYAHPGCGTAESPCAAELLPWEGALLAAIISSPSAYSPRSNPQAALERRNLVLSNMNEQGYITEEELASYSAEPIPRPRQIEPPEESSQAPYFTSWLRQQLVDRYGAGEAFGGGLEVQSTLDLELQREAEEIVAERLGAIEPTAAVVVLDNETAGVRAMVGGSDFDRSPFNLATNGRRQPGSAFKPFTLVTALEFGRSLEETFVSEPKSIPFKAKVMKDGELQTVTESFEPSNYDNAYYGTSSLLSATTNSDNSVYAELGMQLGTRNIAETAHELGIESSLSTNPSMILGGLKTGVTPLEMTHAYETLAEDGRRVSGTMAASEGGPTGIVSVSDEDGDLAPDDTGASGENEVQAEQVVPADVAQTAKSALETVVTSGTGTNAQTGISTWGKTGTTDDNGDAWFCGATEDITTCVWVGRADSNEPMLTEYNGLPVDGGTFPALIFHDVVLAYEQLKVEREAAEDAGLTAASPAEVTP